MVSEESQKTEEFRQEVRAWLVENLPKGWRTPEYIPPPRFSKEAREANKEWTKKLYDAGYTAFRYPKEYGGIERPDWQIAIIRDEMARTGMPQGSPSLSLGTFAGTILEHGQEWQKKRFLPKMASGEESWVQGFSEPNAGSDLANVQTTAVRDGDEWVANGQKVWNSNWEFADWGVLVVKTDPEAPRHRNLSYFIFDCNSPGFTRRPLRQMTGESEFSELFFDNMRIPHENLIGELNMGWYAAMGTLVAERGGGGIGLRTGGATVKTVGDVGHLVELAKNTRRRGKAVWENTTFRQRIAQLAIENTAIEYSRARAAARMAKGIPLADEVNISKLFMAEKNQRQGEMMLEIMGAYSQLWRGSKYAISDGDFVFDALRSRGNTIEQGTSEINRNIIAERILGLPRIK